VLAVFLDGLGECDKRGQAAALSPGQPPCQQGCCCGQVMGLEDRSELFFKEVGPIERAVGGLDGGQRGALVDGEGFGFSPVPIGCV
jgi:hypothetical protein